MKSKQTLRELYNESKTSLPFNEWVDARHREGKIYVYANWDKDSKRNNLYVACETCGIMHPAELTTCPNVSAKKNIGNREVVDG